MKQRPRDNDVRRHRSAPRRATCLSTAILPIALLVSGVAAAQPAAMKIDFNIQAQDLETALITFTEQAHLQLVMNPDDVHALEAPRVTGSLSPQEALGQLLRASGLEYKMTAPGTVVIKPAVQPAPAAAAMVPAPRVAAAPAGIQEVIVTAQKHEENIQTVPLAISALTADDMINKGITSFDGVARATPSVSFTPYPVSSNTLILYMRGVGVEDPGPITSESAVGLYEDGFVISRPNAATFDLADLERVEVLRGPQGTLYGRNTTGGAVNLIGKQPTGKFDFKQSLTFGTRDQFRSLTTVDLPRWGDVATKFTLLKSSIDGFVKNTGSSHDFGEQKQQAGRFSLHWEGPSDVVVDYFMEKGDLDSTPVYFQNPDLAGIEIAPGFVYPANDKPASHTYRPIDLELSTSSFEGHGLTVAWDVNDELTIKSLTGYRKLDSDAYQDFAEVFGTAYTTRTLIDQHQFSEELQFIGDLRDAHVNYLVGLYYFTESGSSAGFIDYPDYGFVNEKDLDADASSRAVFGQATWTPPVLDDRLSFTLGARYTKDRRKAERELLSSFMGETSVVETGANNSVDSNQFNPAFTVSYQWDEDLNAYAKVATGYRAGGSYGGAPVGRFNHTTDPEKLTSYEVGMKSYWFDRRVRLNMAGFVSKYRDMQLLLLADPNDSSVNELYNAGKSTIHGLEVEALYAPTEDFSVSLDYSYLNAVFDSVDVIPGTVIDHDTNPASPYRVGDNVKGLFALPFAPKNSVALSADYTFLHFDSGKLSAHLDYRWQDRIYLGSGAGPDVPGRDFNSQPGYGLLNGRLSMALDLPRGDRATVSLWGKNLANREYVQYGIPLYGGVVPIQNAGGNVTPAGYTTQASAWSEPPSYGVDLVYEY